MSNAQKVSDERLARMTWRNVAPHEIEAVITELQSLRAAPTPDAHSEVGDWRDDPSSDERWNEGVNYAITQLCEVFGVDPKSISWDAATETLDGDVSSVLCNVMVAAYGEEWSSNERDTAIIREALTAVGMKGEPLHVPVGWHLVPEVPTDEQMNAGLYQASHDATYADVCQSYMDMVRTDVGAPVLTAGVVKAEPVAWPPKKGSLVSVQFEVVGHCSMGNPSWVSLMAPGISTTVDYADHDTIGYAALASKPEGER